MVISKDAHIVKVKIKFFDMMMEKELLKIVNYVMEMDI